MSSVIEELEKWLETLPEDDYSRFMSGISIPALLILFKHFPNNPTVQELLKEKI